MYFTETQKRVIRTIRSHERQVLDSIQKKLRQKNLRIAKIKARLTNNEYNS